MKEKLERRFDTSSSQISWHRLPRKKLTNRSTFMLVLLVSAIASTILLTLTQLLLYETRSTVNVTTIYFTSVLEQPTTFQKTKVDVPKVNQSPEKLAVTKVVNRSSLDSKDESKPFQSLLASPLVPLQIPWLETYVPWHAQRLEHANLQNFIANNNDDPNQYLVWKCYPRGTCGGIGDRLNGIFQAFFMAVCTKRVFIIDNDDSFNYKKDSNNNTTSWLDALLPHRINWNKVDLISTTQNIFRLDTTDNRTDTYLRTLQNELGSYKIVELHNNIYFGDEYWSAPDSCLWKDVDKNYYFNKTIDKITFPLFRTAFETLFQWHPRVPEQAQKLLQTADMMQSSTSFSSNKYLGWHVRTGPGKTWSDPPRISRVLGKIVNVKNSNNGRKSWLKTMLQCVQSVQHVYKARCNFYNNSNSNSNSNSLPFVYLAADKDSVKQHVAHDKVASATIRYTKDLEILHVDKSRLNEIHDLNEARWNVWAELYILIHADCLVTSRSKFSDLARILGKQQHNLQRSRCSVYWEDCSNETVIKAIKYASC